MLPQAVDHQARTARPTGIALLLCFHHVPYAQVRLNTHVICLPIINASQNDKLTTRRRRSAIVNKSILNPYCLALLVIFNSCTMYLSSSSRCNNECVLGALSNRKGCEEFSVTWQIFDRQQGEETLRGISRGLMYSFQEEFSFELLALCLENASSGAQAINYNRTWLDATAPVIKLVRNGADKSKGSHTVILIAVAGSCSAIIPRNTTIAVHTCVAYCCNHSIRSIAPT